MMASLSMLGSATLSANTLASWTFNEAAGTTLTNVVESVGGASFSGNITGVTTNGTGQLNYRATTNWPDRTALLPTNPTGIYGLEIVISNWDVRNFPLTEGPRLMFGFYATTNMENSVVGELELQFFGGGVDLYFVDSSEEVPFIGFAPALLESPLTLNMTIDTVGNTFSFGYSYLLGADLITGGDSGNLSLGSAGRDITRFGITSNRTFNVSGAIAPQIDSITITSIPEPSTYALILGVLGFAGVLLRRRIKA